MGHSEGSGLQTAARPVGWRATSVPVNGRGSKPVRRLAISSVLGFLVVSLSGGLFWLVWIYASGLRDPRYLDGWVLAGGMGLQLCYHIAVKSARLSPKSIMRWRKVHVFLGYLLIGAFFSHSDFSLPDTGFEWALWAGFVLVALSGLFGTYLAWALPAKHGIDESINYERIPSLRAGLAREMLAVVEKTDPNAASNALPAPPFDAWITDLYNNHLRTFFEGQRNSSAHLVGSQHPLKLLTDEIDSLSRYVDQRSQEKLASIRTLVIEKDRLDFARVYLGLTRGWMLVHVPVTYALIVLTVLHILVVYSYSSGVW